MDFFLGVMVYTVQYSFNTVNNHGRSTRSAYHDEMTDVDRRRCTDVMRHTATCEAFGSLDTHHQSADVDITAPSQRLT